MRRRRVFRDALQGEERDISGFGLFSLTPRWCREEPNLWRLVVGALRPGPHGELNCF